MRYTCVYTCTHVQRTPACAREPQSVMNCGHQEAQDRLIKDLGTQLCFQVVLHGLRKRIRLANAPLSLGKSSASYRYTDQENVLTRTYSAFLGNKPLNFMVMWHWKAIMAV